MKKVLNYEWAWNFLQLNILKGNIIRVQIITPLKLRIVKLNEIVKIQMLGEAGNVLTKNSSSTHCILFPEGKKKLALKCKI